MTIATNSSHDSNGYKTLFGYGHLRGKFLHSDMSGGKLHIDHFVRPEFLSELREQLITNQDILTQTPNTTLQRDLAPASRQCLWELHSGIMLRALENITDLTNLLPDTHCKSTRLLFPSGTGMPLAQWHDPSTKLDVALVLVILLDQGDAMLFTTPDAFSATSISSVALQVTYWKNNRAMHGNGTGANA
jgi:hypothetical protein